MRHRVLVPLLAVLVSGCVSDAPDAPSTQPTTPAPSAVEPAPGITVATPAPLAQNATANGTWSSVRLIAEGEAGTWLMAYQPLANATDSVAFAWDVEVKVATVEGEPASLFVVPPHPAFDCGDGIELMFLADTILRHTTDGSTVDLDEGGQIWWGSSCTFPGFFFAVASDHAWTANISATVEDAKGPEVAPTFLAGGNGSLFVMGGQRPLDAPFTPAGVVSLDAELAEPGWSHFEVVFDPLQPLGARKYDVAFPDGTTPGLLQYRYGFYAPLVGGSAAVSGVDRVGTMTDEAGTFHAEVVHAEADLSLDLALVHLPGAGDKLPEGAVGGGYVSFASPFPGG